MMLRAGGIKPAAIHIRAFMAESSAPLLIIPTVIARLAAFAKASAGLRPQARRSLGVDGTGRPSIPETLVIN
jgi:hypothetical protein